MKHMLNLKTLILDFLFITIGCICLFFYDNYNGAPLHSALLFVCFAALIIIIYLYPLKVKEDKHIYENKKALIVFFIIEVFMLIMAYILSNKLNLNNSTTSYFNGTYIWLLQIGITSTLLISYLFKIKLKKFNWNISLKSFILVILVYIVYKLIYNIYGIYNSEIYFSNILAMKFVLIFINRAVYESFYPGIFEEVLCRGLLISGLKGFGLSDNKCNIIQAIIFGMTHIMSLGTPSWIFLLSTASQAMFGYIQGKIYFKTKSLVPCIILHGLMDVVV